MGYVRSVLKVFIRIRINLRQDPGHIGTTVVRLVPYLIRLISVRIRKDPGTTWKYMHDPNYFRAYCKEKKNVYFYIWSIKKKEFAVNLSGSVFMKGPDPDPVDWNRICQPWQGPGHRHYFKIYERAILCSRIYNSNNGYTSNTGGIKQETLWNR